MKIEDVSRVARLGLLLQLGDAEVGPVVLAASGAGKGLVVGASAHGGRLEVRMPYRPEAASALAPAGAAILDRADEIRASIAGDQRRVTFVRSGHAEIDAALAEVAPESVREAWAELLTSLCSIANGKITVIGREVDRAAAVIELRYPQRDRDADAMLIEALDELGGGLGISGAQRTLFRRIHPQLGLGAEMVLTTRCTPDGISPTFGVGYPITDWQTAMRLGEGVVLNDSEAKEVPRRLGAVAGVTGAETLLGVEVILGPNEPPDVLVWSPVLP
jgi:hypothetical protein